MKFKYSIKQNIAHIKIIDDNFTNSFQYKIILCIIIICNIGILEAHNYLQDKGESAYFIEMAYHRYTEDEGNTFLLSPGYTYNGRLSISGNFSYYHRNNYIGDKYTNYIGAEASYSFIKGNNLNIVLFSSYRFGSQTYKITNEEQIAELEGISTVNSVLHNCKLGVQAYYRIGINDQFSILLSFDVFPEKDFDITLNTAYAGASFSAHYLSYRIKGLILYKNKYIYAKVKKMDLYAGITSEPFSLSYELGLGLLLKKQ